MDKVQIEIKEIKRFLITLTEDLETVTTLVNGLESLTVAEQEPASKQEQDVKPQATETEPIKTLENSTAIEKIEAIGLIPKVKNDPKFIETMEQAMDQLGNKEYDRVLKQVMYQYQNKKINNVYGYLIKTFTKVLES